MDADQQLLYEARVRNRQAVVAGVAGLLLLAAGLIATVGPHAKVSELTVELITANKRFPLDLIAAVVNALGFLAMAWTLNYLYVCSRARNAAVRSFVRWIALAGGVLAGVSGIGYSIVVAMKVHQFVTTGAQTYEEANHLTTAGGLVTLQLLGQLAALLLAAGVVLISLNAMRQGLLTRFMGYLGILAGALTLFQVTQVPVVQGFWLIALGYLFSGRWPTGVPPAWRSGRAEPWPSSAQMRAERAANIAARRGGAPGSEPARQPARKPAPQSAGAPAPVPTRTRATTPKRKRKRRN
jgi:hypothetical protein